MKKTTIILIALAAGFLVEAAVEMGIAASRRPPKKPSAVPIVPAPTPQPVRAESPSNRKCEGQRCQSQSQPAKVQK